jgi:acyl carrier protein phosphodiesterase
VNWLAHLRLSPAQPLLRLGNLAGDFVRGIDVSTLHPEIQRGVVLHRAIDKFVDAHEVFRRARTRFAEPFQRYGSVALDVFFDHYLARDWHRHGDGSELGQFVADVHAAMQQHRELLPPDLQRLNDRMAENSWLTMYGTVDGIERVLRAMAKRRRRPSSLATITGELRRNYDAFESDFEELWPELLRFVAGRNTT